MDDHLHLILEVPPMPKNGISDEELLRRVAGHAALYGQEHAGFAERNRLRARG
jgi:REP element-mobilizing transposase RayT